MRNQVLIKFADRRYVSDFNFMHKTFSVHRLGRTVNGGYGKISLIGVFKLKRNDQTAV